MEDKRLNEQNQESSDKKNLQDVLPSNVENGVSDVKENTESKVYGTTDKEECINTVEVSEAATGDVTADACDGGERNGESIVAPRTFKEKLSNFWYHYKWHTIVSCVVVAVVAILLRQLLTKEKYDINVVYAGGHTFSLSAGEGDTAAFETARKSFARVAEDYDKNGKISVNFMHYYVLTEWEIRELEDKGREVNYATIKNNYENLTSVIMTGNACVMLLSESVYNDYYDRYDGKIFVDLSRYLDKSQIDDYEFVGDDKKAVRFSSLKFSSLPELENLPEDTVLCLRCENETGTFGANGNKDAFPRAEAMIKKIFEFE